MLFRKLSTIERVYNIGMEHDSINYVFNYITNFIKESERDLVKLYDLKVLDKIVINDIMTKDLVILDEEESIDELGKLIKQYRHMGYPVFNSNEELVGIVTFDDLRTKKSSMPRLKKLKIKDIMTKKDEIISISPYSSASEAQKIMVEYDIGRVLVVDDGKLKGIVTKGDIVRTSEIYNPEPKINKCSHITNIYFYGDNPKKVEELAEEIIVLMGARGYIISEKEDFIEISDREWEPIAKIMKRNGKIDHISIDTKLINILELNIIKEVFKLIEKPKFEEVIITDHITLVDEKSAIQRIITDVTMFEKSMKTFGTITVRIDF
ncbi:CBS domain-containing protein [Methanococcus maripaludis]|uniref:CBS domain-containing protein n=1 Tax=Methanococcus maripaludis TaxID=39152 RepID=A0A7J9PSJ7_METMI|nr:CBS domain-containing protein [Methanococcus maripaludis]MBA2840825.1 CBS domain-containing protein [Methanococcus maripaludis]MBA2853048.1 CBS domain-containing protein [Methanococcus maripaludis]MBA2860531.1 CBS domain-containing protein [Methanococcus maripaludis]MBA2868992.1 CBS domain-containing protein [Methanococcus maripaludis]MBB6401649.1 CBS domain-containing protein [Methanococcus maripaludis]